MYSDQTNIMAMQKSKEAMQLIKKNSFTDDYSATDSESLGILVSKVLEWDGLQILETLGFALENANFHSENAQVQEMITKLK